jgi:hypothetical protein
MKVYTVIDQRCPFNLDINILVFSSKELAEVYIEETFLMKEDYKMQEHEVIE